MTNLTKNKYKGIDSQLLFASDVSNEMLPRVVGNVASVSGQTKPEYTNNSSVGEGNYDTKLCK